MSDVQAYIHILEAKIARLAQRLAEYEQTYDVRLDELAAYGGGPGYALVLPCGFVYRIKHVTLFKLPSNPRLRQTAKFQEAMKAMLSWLGIPSGDYEEIAVEIRDNAMVELSIVCTPQGNTHFRYVTKYGDVEDMTVRNAEYIIRKIAENFEIVSA